MEQDKQEEKQLLQIALDNHPKFKFHTLTENDKEVFVHNEETCPRCVAIRMVES